MATTLKDATFLVETGGCEVGIFIGGKYADPANDLMIDAPRGGALSRSPIGSETSTVATLTPVMNSGR